MEDIMDNTSILAIIVMLAFGVLCLCGIVISVSEMCRILIKNKSPIKKRLIRFFAPINIAFINAVNYVRKTAYWAIFSSWCESAEYNNYYRKKAFLRMQNNGSDPCEIKKPIVINYTFTDYQMYI